MKSLAAIEVFYSALGCTVETVHKCEISDVDVVELVKGDPLMMCKDVSSLLSQSQELAFDVLMGRSVQGNGIKPRHDAE